MKGGAGDGGAADVAGGEDLGAAWMRHMRAGEWDAAWRVSDCVLAPLAQVSGVELHVLQRGGGLAGREEGFGIVWGSDDPYEAARVMRALGLVNSIGSMPAHLAGALGVPVWTLLHSDPDWRWMLNRDDSPWYPTMRLFRQERPGDWESVIARVAAELGRLRDG